MVRTTILAAAAAALLLGCNAEPRTQASASGTAAMQASTALDGTTWTIRVVPDAASAAAGEQPFDDQLVFASGRVRSTACEPYGFRASAYATADGGTRFETRQASEQAGETRWVGTVHGDRVEGTLETLHKDGTKARATFSGTRG